MRLRTVDMITLQICDTLFAGKHGQIADPVELLLSKCKFKKLVFLFIVRYVLDDTSTIKHITHSKF